MIKRSCSLLLVGALVALAMSLVGLSASGASAIPSIVGTQTVSGGGSGVVIVGVTVPNFPYYEGSYTSTSQLGTGRYVLQELSTGVTFTRSDGMRLTGSFGNPIFNDCGALDANTMCEHLDLVGTADIAAAHLALAISEDSGTTEIIDHRAASPAGFLMRGTMTLRRWLGYAMVDSNGAVSTFGGIEHFGDAHTSSATDTKLTPSHNGYWVVNAAGQVFAFGDAPVLGNANPSSLAVGETVTSMSVTPTGKGYWLFSSKGRAVPFGDAHFYGDLHTTPLTGPVVGSVATPTGHGYYMVGSDGGVFAFGDARFQGSMGATRLNQPVVGLTPTPDNRGYWLVAADGGVFSFNAHFYGSMGAIHLNQPVVTMVPSGPAYLMIARDGGVFTFANAPFFGSLGGTTLAAPIVNGTATG